MLLSFTPLLHELFHVYISEGFGKIYCTFQYSINKCGVMLMSALRVLINNQVKESFYGEKKN